MWCIINETIPVFNLITLTLNVHYLGHINVSAWNTDQRSSE